MIDAKPFDKPVIVAFGPAGKRHVVSTTQEAVDCLSSDWPPDRGPRHRDALETCYKVLEGNRSTVDAKNAFMEAAKESGVLVPGTPD